MIFIMWGINAIIGLGGVVMGWGQPRKIGIGDLIGCFLMIIAFFVVIIF
jgi:hypothetical protein